MAFAHLRGWFAFSAVASLVWACSSKQAAETSPTSSGTAGSTSVSASVASTGSGGASASTASSSGAGGHAMIDCPKGGYTDLKGECDLLQQNCPDGDTCGPVQVSGAWTTKCYVANGLKGITLSCSADAECAAGLFCVFNTCTPICCPDTNEPCKGGTCNVSQQIGTTNFDLACSFAQACMLLMKDACPAGQDCHLQDASQGLASCTPPSGSQVDEGGACMYLNDCKANQFCYTAVAGMPGVCRWHCDTTDKTMDPPGLGACPMGESCTLFQFGVPNLGLCLPP